MFSIKWAIPGIFFFTLIFSIQLMQKKLRDDRIRTDDLQCQKQLVYQLSPQPLPWNS